MQTHTTLISLLAAPLLASALTAQAAVPLRLASGLDISPDGKHIAFVHGGDLWQVSSKGGVATRLTTGPWDDQTPSYSPCGKWLAFMSDRSPDGTFAYVMPAGGGPAQQVTQYRLSHWLEGWSSDGKSLYLRLSPYSKAYDDTRIAKAKLGPLNAPLIKTPYEMVFDAYGLLSKESPNGKNLLFCRSGRNTWRRDFRGPASRQIWLAKLGKKVPSFERLSLADDQGMNVMHASPQWINDHEILYIAEFAGVRDIFRRDLSTGVSSRVTSYGVGSRRGADGVAQARLSRDGKTLIYRYQWNYWLKDLSSDAPAKKLEIRVPDERLEWTKERVQLNRAKDVAFTYDGKEMAFSTGGEIYVMDRILREPRRMTHSRGSDSNLIFSKDGRRLYFVSYRTGYPDIWVAKRKDERRPWFLQKEFVFEQITNDKATERGLSLSPNEKRLTFVRNGELVHTALDGTDEKVAFRSWSFPAYDWSPDSNWFVLTTRDENYNNDIWIVDAEGKQRPINISRHPDNDYYGVWSPDGKRIAWIGRHGANEIDIYYVNLFRRDEEMTDNDKKRMAAMKVFAQPKRRVRTRPRPMPKPKRIVKPKTAAKPSPTKASAQKPVAVKKPAAAKPAPAKKPAAAKPTAQKKLVVKKPLVVKKVAVKKPTAKLTVAKKPAPKKLVVAKKPAAPKAKPKAIKPAFEREGLFDRVHHIRIMGSDESRLMWSPDGRQLYFTGTIGGKKGYFALPFPLSRSSRPALRMSAPPSAAHWLKTGELAGLIGGEPGTIRPGNKIAKFSFSIPMEFDWRDRREEILTEVWFAIRDGFYDPAMNNLDWDAVLKKYQPLAREMVFKEQFEALVQSMLGELNASHMGYSYPKRMASRSSKPRPGWTSTRYDLGVDFDRSAGGPGLLVSKVIHKSPASLLRSQIRVGERILSIDGKKVGPKTLLAPLLTLATKRSFLIEVQGKDGKKRRFRLDPITLGKRRVLLYADWVERTRQAVEKMSKGRLGYLHIRGMNMPSFRRMEQDIYAAGAGKDVLLVDVRYNGGGSTADHVLTLLCQPSHALTLGNRGKVAGYPQDRYIYATWNKPIVLLCNERSFSNAEILAHAIKTLGRGPVVGERTAGGVISTGAAGMSDGSFLRMPGRGWFSIKTGLDMEMNGCMPNHRVLVLPEHEISGKDAQLEKAIEVGLKLAAEEDAKPKPQLIRKSRLQGR